MIKKYLTILKTELNRQFVYRASIAGYVPGNFFELFAQVIIWTVIFQNVELVRGYTYDEMITYIVVGWIFIFITSNYRFEKNIARDIRLGTLANFIIKPISYLKYITAVSVGRVIIAFSIVIFQSIFYIAIFYEHIIFNIGILDIFIIIIMLALGFFIKLFFSFLIGLIAFWTTEINGIFLSLHVAIKFLSGTYFPINLLSASIVNFSLLFPFVYTFFVPVQFYLGKITRIEALKAIGIEVVWLIILFAIIKIVWKFGLKKHEGVGI